MQMPVMAKGVFMDALYGLMGILRQGAKNRRGSEPIGSPFVGYQDFVKHSGAVFDDPEGLNQIRHEFD
jgi:hypothetical protein